MFDKYGSDSVRPLKYTFHEFMVDFLGGLVPGTIFLIGLSLSLLPPFHLLYSLLISKECLSLAELFLEALIAAKQTPNMIWIGIFAFIIAISYVLGHLFYRKGPGEPDQRSFSRAAEKIKENIPADLAEKDYLKRDLACDTKENCEFPYPHLKEYLGQRSLCHLCPFVIWKNGETKLFRSKTYINLLKIRLKYHYPDRCSNIIRNEAHVRMSSSTWYVSKALFKCGIVGISAFFLLSCFTVLIIS